MQGLAADFLDLDLEDIAHRLGGEDQRGRHRGLADQAIDQMAESGNRHQGWRRQDGLRRSLRRHDLGPGLAVRSLDSALRLASITVLGLHGLIMEDVAAAVLITFELRYKAELQ